MTPQEYLDKYELWDLERLKQHAQEHSVYVIESPRFPGAVMLHYQDSCTYNNTWDELSRISRGLLLDMKNKKVLAHPFNKWFNLGQMPETCYESLKSLGSFQTSEKLDGSLCIGFWNPNDGTYHLTTKGSLNSDHGAYATQLFHNDHDVTHPYYEQYTLMWELITKKFQIVINYEKKGYKEGLYLIGARDNWSGKLSSYKEVQKIAEELGFNTFKIYSFDTLDQLIENTKNLSICEEGYVLRFNQNDLMVKVKGPKYLEMHRFISNLSDKNILLAVAEEKDVDLLEHCPEEYVDEVKAKIYYFKRRYIELFDILNVYFNQSNRNSRKEYSLWVQKNVDKEYWGFMFDFYKSRVLMEKDVDYNKKKAYTLIGEQEKITGETKI